MKIEASAVTHTSDLTHEGPIPRGVALLRLLATAGRRGAALTTLAQRTGLPNSTVHRLLAQLMKMRLVMQIDDRQAYMLGPLAYELGLVAAQQFDIRELCRPAMQRLASDSSETVYLVQRSGMEAVCIDFQQGPGTLRVVTLQMGSRRPLGLGAGGLAILAAMNAEESEEVLAAVIGSIENEWHFPQSELRDSLAQTRMQGYAVIKNRITPGVTAFGKAFRDSLGQVFGAVTVAGMNSRLTPARIEMLLASLVNAATTIEKALRSHQWARHVPK
jgi:DNA-binding IclR family transcriptional regulator